MTAEPGAVALTTNADGTASARMTALGTSALLVVTAPKLIDAGARLLRTGLAEIDQACSRFRADSEISRLHANAGREVAISPLLTEALEVALRAARLTDGIVDPTVGTAVSRLGYDRDFADLTDSDLAPEAQRPVPGWWRISLDTARGRVLLPRGINLDLGATAKALAADRAANRIADALGCGTLVSLGGDLAVAGPAPVDGWRLGIGEDHRRAETEPDAMVTITTGGLATSSTTCRRWRRGGRELHHIVDPRTGDLPAAYWRTVSVAAARCVDANTASTAAIVLGESAADWLRGLGLPARLVGVDGAVSTVAGWPTGELPEPAGLVGAAR
ncbi:MAG TPA: FAD:protein FMN transferase [Pseudonocardiaceae bacterium]|jgi:thiamine biosynthesis lipoprotein|nr:FAD:protein FMN transferase [Pseudonocardiaceae bacterium]